MNSRKIQVNSVTSLREFQQYLVQCNNIIALCGAGLSVASGIPTFRGSNGLWKEYSQIDLATPEAFQSDPSLVWQFYSARRYQALNAKPNKGHFSLAELSQRLNNNHNKKNINLYDNLYNKKFITLTQNVDALSLRANHDPNTLLQLHGSLFDLKCTGFLCNYHEENRFTHPLVPALELSNLDKAFHSINEKLKKRKIVSDSQNNNNDIEFEEVDDQNVQYDPVKDIKIEDLPHCPKCKKNLLRPSIVWFGESLPLNVIDKADNFIEENKIDLILVIGTSGTVWPAMGYVERVIRQGGKVAIFNTEIDLEELKKDGVGWGFKGDCEKLLPKALEPLIGKSEYYSTRKNYH
ncbi:DHS-like NAD/FAD-binding domain-containing protein [Ascoidea rubescens DSM 1968]|uniref:DHS-like NAD/FAD-binding domain-containing protein n=1 Tax=Ascoidea rubescens DSM 1968 TaxID=1344418 RepID=A0A1D2VA54_9ASCO|nr:DHS-like NAD/FAD-binding domain-containing protein [Ascoidea rubescens DSM 1968]ODV58534.1 DHS-like NAD/FAD-binding domain-containing protein [Ascoidea rubescens DSM 1968]